MSADLHVASRAASPNPLPSIPDQRPLPDGAELRECDLLQGPLTPRDEQLLAGPLMPEALLGPQSLALS